MVKEGRPTRCLVLSIGDTCPEIWTQRDTAAAARRGDVLANGWVEGSWGRMGGRLAVTCGGWAELLGVICEDIGGPGKAEEDLVVSKVNSGIVHFSASELNIRFTPKSR
jgi:hypothetical protein